MTTETNLLDLPVGTKVLASVVQNSAEVYTLGGPRDAEYRTKGRLGVDSGGWIHPHEIEEVLEVPVKQNAMERFRINEELAAAEQEVNLASAKYALAAGGVRLGFGYKDANDEFSYRHVVPTEVKESRYAVLLVAYDVTDEQGDKLRTFRLDRIVGVCEIEFRF